MTRLALAAVLLLASGCSLLRPTPATTAAPAPAARPTGAASRDATPKPFAEVVTRPTTTDDGLLTVYRSEGGLRLMAAIRTRSSGARCCS